MHAETSYTEATPSSVTTTALHCKWAATEDEKGMHLIAQWSDHRTENDETAVCAEPRVGPEKGEKCWHTTLYFVWDSHSFSAL
jgi:hypothetical protein